MVQPFRRSSLIFIVVTCAAIFAHQNADAITSYARNDPYPIYTPLDPHHFLATREKARLLGFQYPDDLCEREQLSMSVSVFSQSADKARNICKEVIPLGDIDGRWYMLGLLFGPVPQGQALPPTLVDARQNIFPTIPLDTPINDRSAIDKDEEFGFFSIPAKYRKRGVRAELSAQLTDDIGIQFRLGIADICFTHTGFENLTNDSSFTDPNNADLTVANVNEYLMCNIKNIAPEICLDIDNFHECSVEDVRLALYWRHAYALNEERMDCWPTFILTPFLHLEAGIAAGKERDRNKAFALAFGSNDHHSVGLTAGFDLAFSENFPCRGDDINCGDEFFMEIGGEVGITHYFAKDFCKIPMPTSRCQQGIFPFTTDANIQPGKNWHFGAKLNAYHFLEHLSFYFQYVMVQHSDDEITLKRPDPAFIPSELEKRSTFKAQFGNVGFNYDLSPHVSLGLFWQVPLSQRVAFKSTTIMGGLSVIF